MDIPWWTVSFIVILFCSSLLGGAVGGLAICRLGGPISSLEDFVFCGALGSFGGMVGCAFVGIVGRIYGCKNPFYLILFIVLGAIAGGALLWLVLLYQIARGFGGLSG